ncbi:MAG: hypothetical protein GX638_18640, partial [Crenarchaeota archaeon]|nr:hypothetical protein [Thermoproteota archaeon]
MNKYNLKIEKDLLWIASIDGYDYLIDTGCPTSGRIDDSPNTVTIEGKQYPMYNIRVDREGLNDCLGCKIDGIIGMNILSRRGFSINKEDMTVCFDGTIGDKQLKSIAFENTGFIVISDGITINGHGIGPILDTGAHIGYVCTGILENLEPIGKYEDFNPVLGRMSGDLYSSKVRINNIDFNMKIGIAADRVQQELKKLNCGAIIGIPLEVSRAYFDFV